MRKTGKRKARKAKPGPTAQDKRPLEAAADGSKRVVETIELLYRRGHIDGRQYEAAALFRQAVECASGGVPSSLKSIDTVRGGASRGPTMAQMMAARRLVEARRRLGRVDNRVALLIAGEGLTIEAAAVRMYGNGRVKPSQRDIEYLGKRLRDALRELADAWLGKRKGNGRARAVRTAETDRTRATDAPVDRARVVQVHRHGVREI